MMNKRVLCLLSDGFEEIELVTPVDLLRRAGVGVVIAGVAGWTATGRCGMRLSADELLENLLAHAVELFDMLLIPGGPGVAALRTEGHAAALARDFSNANKDVAAICAAPLVLKDAGLLAGRHFCSHAAAHEELGGGSLDRVVEDANIVTSRGAGTALEFALVLVRRLCGEAVRTKVAGEIHAS